MMIKMIIIITIIFRIQPGRRCLGSRAKAKQSPRRTERRQKLKKATSRLIMNLIRKMSLSLRAVISSEGHLLRKQKLLSFLVITTDILICCPFSTTSEQTNDTIQANIRLTFSAKYVALGLGCRSLHSYRLYQLDRQFCSCDQANVTQLLARLHFFISFYPSACYLLNISLKTSLCNVKRFEKQST